MDKEVRREVSLVHDQQADERGQQAGRGPQQPAGGGDGEVAAANANDEEGVRVGQEARHVGRSECGQGVAGEGGDSDEEVDMVEEADGL